MSWCLSKASRQVKLGEGGAAKLAAARREGGDKETLDHWLSWVRKFISNAKSWIIGTHHGVESKYLGQYLAENAFHFNGRHDSDSLFFRALGACVNAKPKIQQVLYR